MAKEYIERDEVIERIRFYCLDCESLKRYGDACCDSCGIGDALYIIDDQPAVDVVPIDAMFREMMVWAARYAIGRRTYAASDTANYILKLVDKLDNTTLNCLKNDIEAASSLGDECDEKEWMKLLDAVKEELERRKEEKK